MPQAVWLQAVWLQAVWPQVELTEAVRLKLHAEEELEAHQLGHRADVSGRSGGPGVRGSEVGGRGTKVRGLSTPI